MGKKENEELVDDLAKSGYLSKPRIIEAFKKVDRGKFVLPNLRTDSYTDTPLPIGMGQTISAPSMVAIMTENLNPTKGDKVLEIGTGSGYQAALLSKLVGETGKVYTLEIVESLVKFAKKNLKSYKNVKVILSDGSVGYEKEAKYDKIIVTAASPKVPEQLIEQLKKNGVLAIPVGNQFLQRFMLIRKKMADGKEIMEKEHICDCMFVPLIGKEGFE